MFIILAFFTTHIFASAAQEVSGITVFRKSQPQKALLTPQEDGEMKEHLEAMQRARAAAQEAKKKADDLRFQTSSAAALSQQLSTTADYQLGETTALGRVILPEHSAHLAKIGSFFTFKPDENTALFGENIAGLEIKNPFDTKDKAGAMQSSNAFARLNNYMQYYFPLEGAMTNHFEPILRNVPHIQCLLTHTVPADIIGKLMFQQASRSLQGNGNGNTWMHIQLLQESMRNAAPETTGRLDTSLSPSGKFVFTINGISKEVPNEVMAAGLYLVKGLSGRIVEFTPDGVTSFLSTRVLAVKEKKITALQRKTSGQLLGYIAFALFRDAQKAAKAASAKEKTNLDTLIATDTRGAYSSRTQEASVAKTEQAPTDQKESFFSWGQPCLLHPGFVLEDCKPHMAKKRIDDQLKYLQDKKEASLDKRVHHLAAYRFLQSESMTQAPQVAILANSSISPGPFFDAAQNPHSKGSEYAEHEETDGEPELDVSNLLTREHLFHTEDTDSTEPASSQGTAEPAVDLFSRVAHAQTLEEMLSHMPKNARRNA
ncbi:MAG: hypothetical protein OXC30_01765 [Alphaproteobacteria bacterium]|nr:hypothetical protein [Alphaproteobacteria bacterium]